MVRAGCPTLLYACQTAQRVAAQFPQLEEGKSLRLLSLLDDEVDDFVGKGVHRVGNVVDE